MNWPIVQLSQICSPKQHRTIPTSSLLDEGFPVYGANGQIGFYSEFTHEEETVAITCRGATCGTINVAPAKAYITGNAMALDDLDRNRVELRFLVYALRNRGLQDVISGSAQPQITRGPLLSVEIPLPPLEEQKRIATILDQADDLRRKRQYAVTRLNQLSQSIFYEMFGASENVRSMPLGEIADLKRGPFGGALKKEIFVPTGYKVYEQGNAIKRSCNVGSYFIDQYKYREMQGFAVAPNDLIVSCSGTIGRTYLIPEGAPPGIINQALLRVRANERLVSPKYLEAVLASSAMQDFLTGFSRGTGLQNFPPMSEVRSIPVPMPSVTGQGKFLQRLEVIEDAYKKASRAEEAHEALFASLQQRAFRGEL